MKKLKLFLVMAACIAALMPITKVSAQLNTGPLYNATYGNFLDTVTDTGNKIMYRQISGDKATISITVDIVKKTGTPAGTMVPVVSNNGTTWYDISQATKDTFTVTNVATTGWRYSLNTVRGFSYYGVKWTGSGTMTGTIAGTLVAHKPGD